MANSYDEKYWKYEEKRARAIFEAFWLSQREKNNDKLTIDQKTDNSSADTTSTADTASMASTANTVPIPQSRLLFVSIKDDEHDPKNVLRAAQERCQVTGVNLIPGDIVAVVEDPDADNSENDTYRNEGKWIWFSADCILPLDVCSADDYGVQYKWMTANLVNSARYWDNSINGHGCYTWFDSSGYHWISDLTDQSSTTSGPTWWVLESDDDPTDRWYILGDSNLKSEEKNKILHQLTCYGRAEEDMDDTHCAVGPKMRLLIDEFGMAF